MKIWKSLLVVVAVFANTATTLAQETDLSRFTKLVPKLVKGEAVTNKTLKGVGVRQIYKGGNGFVVTFKGDETKIKKEFATFLAGKGISYDRIKAKLMWDIYCSG